MKQRSSTGPRADPIERVFAPSGASDDPTDTQLALELLRKHWDKLRPWLPEDE